MKGNIQRSTFNAKRPTERRRGLLVEGWALNVEGSVLLLLALSTLSVFGRTHTNDLPALQPPYGELPPTFWEQHGTTMMTAGFAAIILVVLGIWLRMRPKASVILSPATQARQALEALRHQSESGTLLSDISAILQKYFIAVFELAPGEFTTTELCEAIAGHERIGSELSAAVAGFLRQCDERKFAPDNSAAPMSAVARALELVTLAEQRRVQFQLPPPAATQHAASTAR